VSCIEIYAQSMQSTDDAPVPPARIDVACEPAAPAFIATCRPAGAVSERHDPPIVIRPPFKVPI